MNRELCHVCGSEMDANRASCNECGRDFHLALRVDVAARDCGDAWIDDEVQALIFGCNACLGRSEPAVPPVKKRYARRNRGASAVARARTRSGPAAPRGGGAS